MCLELNAINLRNPQYNYHQQENDFLKASSEKKTWSGQALRVFQATLPFIALYQPSGKPFALIMGSGRIVASISRIHSDVSEGENYQQIAADALQCTVAIIALGSTVFAHPLGMLVTTCHDIGINIFTLHHAWLKNDYVKAKEAGLQLLNNSVYLGMFFTGSSECLVASLAMQIISGIYHSYQEYSHGNYIEAAGGMLMAMVRIHQVSAPVRELQKKWKTVIESKEEAIVNCNVAKADLSPGPKSSPKLVEILVKYGNNPEGIPSLHYAILLKDYTAVDVLLAHGASPFTRDHKGQNCLYYAIKADDLNMVQKFIGLGIGINEPCTDTNSHLFYNPFFVALREGKNSIAKYLLDRGAITENHEGNALEACASAGNYYFMKLFVDRGMKILNKHSHSQEMILANLLQTGGSEAESKRQERVKCFDLLANRGLFSQPFIKDPNQYFQVIANSYPEALTYLLENKYLDPNQRFHGNGWHILALASRNEKYKEDLVRILLKNGADINSLSFGRNLLCLAMENGSYNEKAFNDEKTFMKFLLNMGLDINAKCEDGSTTLNIAKQLERYRKFISWLIANGAK